MTVPAAAPPVRSRARLRLLPRGALTADMYAGGAPPAQLPDGADRCDLCAGPLPEAHRHLLDVPEAAVNCACRACGLLLGRRSAGGSRYRLLPLERRRLGETDVDESLWRALGVPVTLAFFVPHAGGGVSVGLPSAVGTVRTTVPQGLWRELVSVSPTLAGLDDDVQALLVNRTRGAREYWIVPLDDCYRLAAVVRTRWQGLTGGAALWEHISTFFAELAASRGPRGR